MEYLTQGLDKCVDKSKRSYWKSPKSRGDNLRPYVLPVLTVMELNCLISGFGWEFKNSSSNGNAECLCLDYSSSFPHGTSSI